MSGSESMPIVETLRRIRSGLSPDPTVELRQAIIKSGSATPDNEDCAAHVEAGTVVDARLGLKAFGAKLASHPYMLSDIADAIETAELAPEALGLEDLSPDALAAALRMIVLILVELEATSSLTETPEGG